MRIQHILFLGLFFIVSIQSVSATSNYVCLVYFKGVGCPHCAVTDPFVIGELPMTYSGKLVLIEYETYEKPSNRLVMDVYINQSLAVRGVPQLIYGEGERFVGDSPILDSVEEIIVTRKSSGSGCVLPEGVIPFEEVDLDELAGEPKIWFKDRVLLKDMGGNSDLIKKAFLSDKISNFGSLSQIESFPVSLAGGQILFEKAASSGGWILEYNEVGRAPKDRYEYTSTFMYLVAHINDYMLVVVTLGIIVLALITWKERRSKKE